MMFDNKRLYAANHDCVVVLQLLGREASTTNLSHMLHTGHTIDGAPVELDTATSVTRNIIAGLASALAGAFGRGCVFFV